MRINKYLASCGIASRRKCDEIIASGKIEVNGEKITTLGLDIDVDNDEVKYNGEIVSLETNKVYYMLNKPTGCVSSVSDDRGRQTVLDLVDCKERVFPVGRLDYDSEGLLLLTNDGDVANKIMHPRFIVEKTYIIKIRGEITDEQLDIIEDGVVIDGYQLGRSQIEVLDTIGNSTKLEVKITEGRNRQIRKMFEYVGITVVFLRRISEGKLWLGDLEKGCYRELTSKEIGYIKAL